MGRTLIPPGNIKAYLHWYEIIKSIQKMPFPEEDFNRPLEILQALRKEYGLPKAWECTAYKPINNELVKRTNLLDPFRQVRWYMVYGQKDRKVPWKEFYPGSPDVGKGGYIIRDYKKKRQGARANWAFDTLLYAVVEDCRWWGKGAKFVEAEAVIGELNGELNIEEGEGFTYDNARKRHNGIDHEDVHNILKILAEACRKKGVAFIPSDISISEWPVDFLATIAHRTGHKVNPYLSGEKRMTDQDKEALPAHLKKLLSTRK